MARRTVKIEIPISTPDKFIKLLKNIIKRHEELGKASELNKLKTVNMTTFGTSQTDADAHRSKSEDLREESEAEMELAENLLGTAEGQSINTPGTLYHDVGLILKFFRSEFDGREEEISKWGFPVVIGEAKSPKPRAKKS